MFRKAGITIAVIASGAAFSAVPAMSAPSADNSPIAHSGWLFLLDPWDGSGKCTSNLVTGAFVCPGQLAPGIECPPDREVVRDDVTTFQVTPGCRVLLRTK